MNEKKIPNELKRRDQWICWDESKKPINPETGYGAKAGEPSTWVSFEKAIIYGKLKNLGIGYEFADDDGIIGIDIDGCRNKDTGELAPWAKRIVVELNSYTEVSPSMTGVKIFAYGKSPWSSGHKVDIEAVQVAKKNPGIEIYERERYFTVTGIRLSGLCSLVEIDSDHLKDLVDALPVKRKHVRKRQLEVIERAELYLDKCEPAIDGQRGHDTTFKTACALILGFCLTPEEAYPIFQKWNARCNPPWNEQDLLRKLHEANKQSGERGYLRDGNMSDLGLTCNETGWINLKEYQHAETPHERVSEVAATDLEREVKNLIECLGEDGETVDGTGLNDLDRALDGGFARGEVVLVAARPSHGKTMFGLQMLHHMSCMEPCLIVSEEMSSCALAQRTVQFLSNVHKEHWFSSKEKVIEHANDYFKYRKKVHISEPCRSVHAAAEQVRKFKETEGVQFVLVDYVQLLAHNKRGRYDGVTEASIVLNQVARETGVTMIVLAQLNRSIEKRDAAVPRLSDIRESGQIEQDADVVLMLLWPHRMDSSKPADEFQVFVAKNRNRAIIESAFTCKFEPLRQRLTELDVSDMDNFEPAFDSF